MVLYMAHNLWIMLIWDFINFSVYQNQIGTYRAYCGLNIIKEKGIITELKTLKQQFFTF